MPMYDFVCACGTETEEIVEAGETVSCEKCGKPMQRIWNKFPASPTHIIVDYPGAKRLKAGYVHSHGDRPATRIQSGYGGSQSPQ